MYCPGCSTQTTDEINYCKQCGANLRSVRQALLSGEPEESFDWSKTGLIVSLSMVGLLLLGGGVLLAGKHNRRRRFAAA